MATVFHVTSAGTARKIIRGGFQGSWGDAGFGVYFFTRSQAALEYLSKGGWDGFLKCGVILKAQVPDQKLEQVIPEPGWPNKHKYNYVVWHPVEEDDYTYRLKVPTMIYGRNPSRSRRGRNTPYGPTSAEYQHAGWNPHLRKNRCMGAVGRGGGVLLGKLTELVVEDRSGVIRATPSMLKGLFLAWMPRQKDLAIVRKVKGRPQALSAEVLRIHKQFHQANPSGSAVYEWPDRCGRENQVGLIQSLTYVVPNQIKSPGKIGVQWVHAFGDHGEEGHGPITQQPREKKYPDRLKPALFQNSKGDLFIVRRPGNRYDVTEWIYW